MMTNRYFYDSSKRGGRADDTGGGDGFGRTRSSINTSLGKHETGVHEWVFRISIIVAILLCVSLYFIPFPFNLILFIISLISFLVISFWVHIQSKRQSSSAQDSSSNSYQLSPNLLSSAPVGVVGGGCEPQFVDVPLEPIAITVDQHNGLKQPQFTRI
ncbi:uncharacterized protein LOC128963923 [Oppia nitens]|uniref:uncharacterized protein LOC128963923 n=1 Tax=Oppia nitens TaxID=1686743 RepID=UPI0023DB0D8B|nr:uncharacterized protein LOC128963923 [Oppia nitens]